VKGQTNKPFQKGNGKEMAQQKNICPRCGGFLETLRSYAHCSSCLYFEDYWFDTESAFHQAMKAKKEITQLQEEAVGDEEREIHDDKDCA
jgi:predicted amidophosphoribosyltransferase